MVILQVGRAGYPDRGYPVGCPGRLSETENSMVKTETETRRQRQEQGQGQRQAENSMASTCVVSGLSGALFVGYSAQMYIYKYIHVMR